jgi:hypothetical protein
MSAVGSHHRNHPLLVALLLHALQLLHFSRPVRGCPRVVAHTLQELDIQREQVQAAGVALQNLRMYWVRVRCGVMMWVSPGCSTRVQYAYYACGHCTSACHMATCLFVHALRRPHAVLNALYGGRHLGEGHVAVLQRGPEATAGQQRLAMQRHCQPACLKSTGTLQFWKTVDACTVGHIPSFLT